MRSKLAVLLLSLPLIANANCLVTTTSFGRSAKVEEEKEVSSMHDVYIYNESPFLKVYTMKYILCPQNLGCKTLDEYVYLQSHGTFRKQVKLTIDVKYYMKGTYQLTAQTFIRTNTLLESETTGKSLIQIHG